MNLLTLICARKGSLLKIKTSSYLTVSLIYYTIKSFTSKFIDEVYVSTDSNKISKISKVFGAKIRF